MVHRGCRTKYDSDGAQRLDFPKLLRPGERGLVIVQVGREVVSPSQTAIYVKCPTVHDI